MTKCCAVQQSPRPQRRLNGLQLPLNYQQVIGWVVFIATGLINFVILIHIQFDELRTISFVVLVVFYAGHVLSHLAASLIDPSEKELRNLEVNNVPEFDRSVHAHVIENGRCHLCNIDTTSKKTKHCSICNKCVEHFDHHCKWLNNCIGRRNYTAFIVCVTTALMISTYTLSLCLTDIVMFFTSLNHLSKEAQSYINCGSASLVSTTIYCRRSICFITFLIIYCIVALTITCALLHLYCFHAYISVLGVSTYEYVVRSGNAESCKCKCIRMPLSKRLYTISKSKQTMLSPENPSNSVEGTVRPELHETPIGEANVINFVSLLINSELEKAKKIFTSGKNKIHPHEVSDSR